jgi:CDP-diacylglycerol--serine O-phosphatidyltransferase
MANLRGVFPGAFTMGNMLCGFLAILSAQAENPTAAAWLIILAAFLDGLDGKVARLSGATSRFGQELDSLADVVSFGIAPAVLLHSAKLHIFGKWSFIIGAVYLMCGAYRLARYNLIAEPHSKKTFAGLPIPVAAIAIASYMIASVDLFGEVVFPQFLITMVVGCSALMVSSIDYDALPERFDTRENRWRLLAIFIFFVAIVISPKLAIFPSIAIYILYGFGREVYRILQGGGNGKEAADDSGEEGGLSHPAEIGRGRSSGSNDRESTG